jgi:hypothetical protein
MAVIARVAAAEVNIPNTDYTFTDTNCFVRSVAVI